MTVLVIGSVVVQPGRLREAIALSQEHVKRSRTEPGCTSHAVHQDTENPDRLVFVEQWSDQAALAQHFKVPASREFVRALSALAVGAPSMSIYEASELNA
jgi:quinol monooxygenase YgiN